MEFRVLGPVQAWSGGRQVRLGDRKQRLVCAILLLEANRLVSVDRLVDLLWADEPPPSARRTVQAHLSRLRAVLVRAGDEGEVSLERDGDGYRLAVDPLRIDAHEFRALLALARRAGDDLERADLLDRALALWNGHPLAGVGTEEVRARLCRGLQAVRLTAVEERAEVYLRLGRHAALVEELTDLAARYPHRQRITAALMHVLYLSGGTADALAAYRTARRRFNDELGLEPPAVLQALHLAILRQDPGLHPAPPPAPASAPAG